MNRLRLIRSLFGAQSGSRDCGQEEYAGANDLAAGVALPPAASDARLMQMLTCDAVPSEQMARRESDMRCANQNEYFRQLFETAPLGIVILDRDERIRNANRVWQDMFGFELHEVRGRSIDDCIVPADRRDEAKRLSARILVNETVQFNAKRQTRDGELIDVSFIGTPVIVDGEQVGIYGIYADQTQTVRREREYRRQKEVAELTLNAIADAVVRVGDDGLIAYVNHAAERLLGLPRESLLGRDFHEVCDFIAENSSEPITFQSLGERNPVLMLPESAMLHRKNGTSVAVEGAITTFCGSEKSPQPGGVIVMRDVSERRRAQTALAFRASHDSLTGLLNREEMERRIARAISDSFATGGFSSLLYIDLDQFKVVNDTSGHQAGDRLLQRVAASMRLALREEHLLARLGGDEFAALLPGVRAAEARPFAESILKGIRDIRFFWQGRLFRIGASIGIAEIDAQTRDVAQIMVAADSACYGAKDQGRGRITVADDEDSVLSQRRVEMDWVSRINHALENNCFTLYRQEIRDIDDGKQLGRHWEVLIRMIDANEGIVTPDRFIPAAERYGLMPTIDRWVIGAVFARLHASCEITDTDTCAINISGTSLSDESFPDFIIDCFRSHNVNPQNICFEITETAAAANLEHALQFMNRVRELGCRVSLDDFGSGFSSFTYLKAFRINYLKIDGTFVRDIDTDRVNRVFVESINRIGKSLGIRTIAEYVETEAVLQKLREIGVDCAQGRHVGAPLPWNH